MTWEELKEKVANESGHNIVCDDYVSPWYNDFWFYKDGHIVFDGETIATRRTPDQMLAIMKALQ